MRQLSRSFLSSIKRNCFSSILTKKSRWPEYGLEDFKVPFSSNRHIRSPLKQENALKYLKHTLGRAFPPEIEWFKTKKKLFTQKRIIFKPKYMSTTGKQFPDIIPHISFMYNITLNAINGRKPQFIEYKPIICTSFPFNSLFRFIHILKRIRKSFFKIFKT